VFARRALSEFSQEQSPTSDYLFSFLVDLLGGSIFGLTTGGLLSFGSTVMYPENPQDEAAAAEVFFAKIVYLISAGLERRATLNSRAIN